MSKGKWVDPDINANFAMNQRALVLNQDYSPLTVCSIHRAFLLIYLQKADLISDFDGQYLHTVTDRYPKPAVIRISNYIRIPYKDVELSRQNVFKRDSYCCQYCGTAKDLTLDHVLPRSRKGRSSWTNLVTACKSCNARKGNALPEEIGFILKSKPYKPSYILFLRDLSGFIQDEWRPFLSKARSA